MDHIVATTYCLTEKISESPVISEVFLFLLLGVNHVLYPNSVGTDTFLNLKTVLYSTSDGAQNLGLNHEADSLALPAQFGFNLGFHLCKESPYISIRRLSSHVAYLHF